ncbi:hypothetical protein [uncultured Microbacterium sp.]|uniref:hypothetical protein n=1 Tax=uncultured Microbacterium sp. TaxID=191216 RepID=UPI0025FC98D7|nr:hypothetical protein [uncultured Microbacterium sp.]
MSRSTPGRDFLPTRGRSFITVSVVDENGFTQHHGPVEVRNELVAKILAGLRLQAEPRPKS